MNAKSINAVPSLPQAASSTAAVTPKVYVACLSAYNRGELHGAWIDADLDADNIEAQVQAMLAKSPVPGAEEWAIHDFEGFGGLSVHEFEPLETVSLIGRMVAEHGEAWVGWARHVGMNYATDRGAEERFADAYIGRYDSREDFGEQTAQCILDGAHPTLAAYFNADAFGRDLLLDDYFATEAADGGIHVFDRRA